MKKVKILIPVILIISTMLACAAPIHLGDGIIDQVEQIPTTAARIPTQIAALPQQVLDTQAYANLSDAQVALYERTNPGVVAIMVGSGMGNGQGSGFVFDKEGHIITNYHVVEGAQDIEIDFPSGFKARGEVIGTDKDSDIAVVKIEAPDEELIPLPLGNSDLIRVGQTVVAIGNPYGLDGTMTTGIVSALGRTLDSLHQTQDGSVYTAGDLIQTDAAINPGNSGGPLLNLQGEVIGINRAIRTSGPSLSGDSGNIGIGFAIAINIVKRVVPELIENGKYDYPYLGLSSLPSLSLALQEELGLPQSTGAYIVSIVPGGPADKAGLKPGNVTTNIQGLFKGGDLITAIDGQRILTFGDLLKYLINNKNPGDSVTMTIIRNGSEKEIELKLESRP
jgi:2-alkenal reductase